MVSTPIGVESFNVNVAMGIDQLEVHCTTPGAEHYRRIYQSGNPLTYIGCNIGCRHGAFEAEPYFKNDRDEQQEALVALTSPRRKDQ